ncbi:MAG: protein kinase [Gemmatimonadaceae bacterium]|nr:protein kinase [Gemmatimonadaceae bacterium]
MSSGTPTRTTIGPYRITGFLGAGGMGMVWRASHRDLGRDVAIKRLSESASAGIPLERFRNEARLHGTLNHPRIAQLYDLIEDDGLPCIVMEYVAGPTIEEQLRKGPLPLHTAITLLEMVADAVGYLHQRGIIHRDIKPSNVKLRPDGSPVLLDFGIARADGDPRLTKTGMIIGSPLAIAPEQFEGQALDGRSDIWALGVLFYEMITGRPPFTGDSIASLANVILNTEPIAPSHRVKTLPARVDVLVARCLEREPARRFQTTGALIDALRELRRVTPVAGEAPSVARLGAMPAGRRALMAGGALLALALGVVTVRAALDDPVGPGHGTDSTGMRPLAPATPSAGVTAADLRTTRISIVDGTADVFHDGRQVGTTPYIHSAPVGTSVTLTLRRAGYHDEVVTFIVSDNQREYTLVMQRDASAPIAPAVLGLFGWFRRRRSAVPAGRRASPPGASVTGERIAAARLSFRGAARTDVGCVRDGNEDAVQLVELPDGALVAALCDGMGGHAAGEVASDLAVRTIIEHAAQLDSSAALVSAVDAANRRIRRAVARDRALQGMGTTCVVLRLKEDAALCAHVGDSRAYLFRDGGIYRLTEDHSHVRDLVRDGSLADQDARHHPDKNVILRALGPAEHVEATTWSAPLHLRVGDRFLLSTDGLHDLADDVDFLPALGLQDPESACAALITLARDRGAPDNVTVCIVDVLAAGPAGMADTRVIEVPA